MELTFRRNPEASRLTEHVQRRAEEIDAWTRAFAADSAQNAGVPMRDWLEQFIARQSAQSEPPTGPNSVFGRRSGQAYSVVRRPAPELLLRRDVQDQHRTSLSAAAAPAPAAAPVEPTPLRVAAPDPDVVNCLDDVTRSLRELSDQTKAIETEIGTALAAGRFAAAGTTLASLAPSQDW